MQQGSLLQSGPIMLPSTAAARGRSASGKNSATAERLEQLKQRWPCREQPLEQLAHRITSTGAVEGPLFVFGPPATGKTAVVRDTFRWLGVRHAYVNCQEATKPKPLLSSILHQLKGGKRRRDEGYDCGAKCESITEFLQALPVVVGRQGGCPPCWVVVDNCQRIAGSELLTALMKMRAASGANCGLVMLSAVPWSSGRFLRDTANIVEPARLRFPAYTATELQQILVQRRVRELGAGRAQKDGEAYRQFLNMFVPTFCRASTNLLDVQAAVSLLYPRYKQPLEEGKQAQAPALYARIKEDVRHVVSELDLYGGAASLANSQQPPADTAVGGNEPPMQGRASSQGLSFELPFVSKFLLIAAYIASRNKPTSDRQVFDPGYGRRRRKDAQGADRAAEAALEARLRGPHGFPLERLLAIFTALYSQHQGDDEEEEEEGREGEEGGSRARQAGVQEMQQGEVLMQLATLVSLRLLSQSAGDPLEGGLYRCNVSEDMARKVALNIKVQLTDYLQLG